jgi:hypothetical protein
LNPRSTGRQQVEIGTSTLLGEQLVMLRPELQNINEINDSVMRVFRGWAEREGLPVNVDKVRSALIQDPGEQLSVYLTSVQRAATHQTVIQLGQQYRLIAEKETFELVEVMARHVSEEAMPALRAYAKRIEERALAGIEKAESRVFPVKRERLGHGLYVEVPAALMDSPRVRQALERVRTNYRKLNEVRQKAAAARGREAKALKRKVPTLSNAEAEQMVSMGSEALQELRTVMREEAEYMAEEMGQALRAAVGSGRVDQGTLDLWAYEYRALADETAASMAELERQWDAAFLPDAAPQSEISLTRFTPDGEVVVGS